MIGRRDLANVAFGAVLASWATTAAGCSQVEIRADQDVPQKFVDAIRKGLGRVADTHLHDSVIAVRISTGIGPAGIATSVGKADVVKSLADLRDAKSNVKADGRPDSVHWNKWLRRGPWQVVSYYTEPDNMCGHYRAADMFFSTSPIADEKFGDQASLITKIVIVET